MIADRRQHVDSRIGTRPVDWKTAVHRGRTPAHALLAQNADVAIGRILNIGTPRELAYGRLWPGIPDVYIHMCADRQRDTAKVQFACVRRPKARAHACATMSSETIWSPDQLRLDEPEDETGPWDPIGS